MSDVAGFIARIKAAGFTTRLVSPGGADQVNVYQDDGKLIAAAWPDEDGDWEVIPITEEAQALIDYGNGAGNGPVT